MELWKRYAEDIPACIGEAMDAPEMLRLKGVGMNCGCEYTSFPRFVDLPPYSRYDHSIGAALIVWRFTHSRRQALAALFHDIATPCFAHVVDFMLGDALTQEATEGGTAEIIAASKTICRVLEREDIPLEDVTDYHQYPIADNDSPRLSSDRLEYTLSNMVGYGFTDEAHAIEMLNDLTVGTNEEGVPELIFRSVEMARVFAFGALSMSQIYAGEEDRFAMQALSELLKAAAEDGVIEKDDLWTTEDKLIRKLTADGHYRAEWERFRGYRAIVKDGTGQVIYAKKRFIDPMVMGIGRVRALDKAFAEEAEAFLAEGQEERLRGIRNSEFGIRLRRCQRRSGRVDDSLGEFGMRNSELGYGGVSDVLVVLMRA